ncbi:MAG TPA: hypothetical protein VJ738_16890 [Steroidobacteraceae bacterium]|nr:hypothetical protein [Steroidobacteraceae bacterium]
MRFYDLKLLDPNTGKVWSTDSSGNFVLGKAVTTFTSYANGRVNPGALNLEIDIPVIPFDEVQGKGNITVWGVGLKTLSQSANLNGQNFELRAGMSAGLPLAKPAQAGLIVKGQVFQAFGNWQGVNQTLNLVLYPSLAADHLDISFLWPAGTSLASALAATFSQAFPTYQQKVAISANLTLAHDEAAHATSLGQFADVIRRLTQQAGSAIYGQFYPGVAISVSGQTIVAYDGTQAPPAVQLAFEDLVGQPTWMEPATINFKTVLRADLAVGSQVRFPTGVISPYALTSSAAAYPNVPARSSTIFQGDFVVSEVHHFGNFRQADADSWVTAFSAFPVPKLTSAPRS